MKKMVIIDDEYIVRVGIRETIGWADYGIEIVGEATNGKAGLELIRRHRPDLVISDVKMPVMDGVEMVQTLHRENADLAIIILSGYKDFEFAKGALEHGASAYLLKPIDNGELIAAVLKALASLEEKRSLSQRNAVLESELPAIRRNLLQDLFSGRLDDAAEAKMRLCGIAMPTSGFVMVGLLDDAEHGTPAENDALLETLQTIFGRLESTDVGRFSERLFGALILVFPDPEPLSEGERIAHAALAEWDRSHPETVSLGFSAPFSGWSELPGAFSAARANARNKPYAAINTITLPHGRGEMKPLIAKAMDYVARHYETNLTVKTVTEALYVSESYLLHMFKESTGKTFNEYLTDYRIIVAKKMLREGTYKVYEVAAKVGYSDEKYFSQIFKKKTGMTPSEFATGPR